MRPSPCARWEGFGCAVLVQERNAKHANIETKQVWPPLLVFFNFAVVLEPKSKAAFASSRAS